MVFLHILVSLMDLTLPHQCFRLVIIWESTVNNRGVPLLISCITMFYLMFLVIHANHAKHLINTKHAIIALTCMYVYMCVHMYAGLYVDRCMHDTPSLYL